MRRGDRAHGDRGEDAKPTLFVNGRHLTTEGADQDALDHLVERGGEVALTSAVSSATPEGLRRTHPDRPTRRPWWVSPRMPVRHLWREILAMPWQPIRHGRHQRWNRYRREDLPGNLAEPLRCAAGALEGDGSCACCRSRYSSGPLSDGRIGRVEVGQVERADQRGLVGGQVEVPQQSADDQVRRHRVVRSGCAFSSAARASWALIVIVRTRPRSSTSNRPAAAAVRMSRSARGAPRVRRMPSAHGAEACG